MNDAANGKVSKWIFLVGDAGLMIFGYFFVLYSPLPIRHWEIAAGCVALGAILGAGNGANGQAGVLAALERADHKGAKALVQDLLAIAGIITGCVFFLIRRPVVRVMQTKM